MTAPTNLTATNAHKVVCSREYLDFRQRKI